MHVSCTRPPSFVHCLVTACCWGWNYKATVLPLFVDLWLHGPCLWPLVKLFDDGAISVCLMLELQWAGGSFSSLHGLIQVWRAGASVGCSPFFECDDGRALHALTGGLICLVLSAAGSLCCLRSCAFFPSHGLAFPACLHHGRALLQFACRRLLNYGKGSWVIKLLSGCLRMVLRSCPHLLALRQLSLLYGSAVWLSFSSCWLGWQLGWAGFWFRLSLWFSCFFPAFVSFRELLPPLLVFSLYFAGFSFLFLMRILFLIWAYVFILFSAGFQLVLQACLALFNLIYFLHLIKKISSQ